MKIDFKINDTNKIKDLLEKAKNKVKENNGTIDGNEFTIKTMIGSFKGSFYTTDNVVTVDIKKKPFIVSEDLVSKEINKMFKEILNG